MKQKFTSVKKLTDGRIDHVKRLLIFVIPFAVVGALILAYSRAATSPSFMEPEQGQITSPAMYMADNSASGGGMVMFGSGGGGMNMDQIPLDQLPKGSPGSNMILKQIGGGSMTPSGDGSGNARYTCSYSHMNYDDPIVYPGQQGASHLHVFFGNTLTNYQTTTANMRDKIDATHFKASSTCTGGAANLTAYWAPALLNNGVPVKPGFSGEVDEFNYYKSGYRSVSHSSIHNIPAGFKMIAGNKNSLVGQSPDIVEWYCDPKGNPGQTPTQVIPNCAAGKRLELDITFPQCWDGVNTDSADHQSHLRYPGTSLAIMPPNTKGDYGDGCTKEIGFTTPIPVISIQINYTVPAGGTGGLRLASDLPNAQPGASAHADFMEGWDPDIRTEFITNCIIGLRDTTRGLCDGNTLLDP